MLAEKKPDDQLFDTMDATDLNKRLKELMDGLSVKVLSLPPPHQSLALIGGDVNQRCEQVNLAVK